MDTLEGIWRLVESQAWDEHDRPLPAPYGAHPIGTLVLTQGRMLAALCNGDNDRADGSPRAYSSYGGVYRFREPTLEVIVDLASDRSRIGSTQVREVVLMDERRILLRPPRRQYGSAIQRRELLWERAWTPGTP
ncbi:lipocalin-like domain-containing protein [Achromobacter piechaudii]|nr:lipocalin-like domain-containing protein [Achromobacter piechaudii]